MTLHLADKWVWDFWLAQAGEFTHMFYLQAPRIEGDADKRHRHASIGHARSRDLSNWEILPDALQPDDDPAAWDSLATWTGSVLKHGDAWYLLYTGINRVEDGQVQRIGLAKSTDLIHWEKYPDNPVIPIDSNRYEILDKEIWYEESWRDPWVFAWEGKYHALITARIKHGEPRSRGVIAHAVSEDLIKWQVKEPITEPGEFAYLEVPQVVQIDKHWYLFFSVEKERYSLEREKRPGVRPQTGTHYLVGEHPLGPYRMITDDFLCGDAAGSFYSGKAVQMSDGQWALQACQQYKGNSEFIGEISDPMPIQIEWGGHLVLRENMNMEVALHER